MRDLRRERASSGRSDGQPLLGSDSYLGRPDLWEFLTRESYPDGAERQTGTLLIFAEDGALKGCLSDRDQLMRCFVTAASWEGLLEALEGALGDGGAEWRNYTPPPSPKGRRKGR